MNETKTYGKNTGQRDMETLPDQNKADEKTRNDAGEGNIEHVTEKGLPPGIEANDLFNPNGNRPRDVPNGDNS